MKPSYAVIGLYPVGSDSPQIVSMQGRVVIFDHLEIAKQFLPLLGNGRLCAWDADEETVFFTPIDPNGVNRACVITGYDVYDVPAGLNIARADGTRTYRIRSENPWKAWKHHVMWSHAFFDCGQMVQRPDGTWANTALGEE